MLKLYIVPIPMMCILTLSRSTSVINIPNSEHIHASDKFILSFISVRSFAEQERVKYFEKIQKKCLSFILSPLKITSLQYFQIPMSHVWSLMSNVKSPMSSWNWRSWQFPVYWSLTLKQLHLVSIDFIYKFSVFCPPLSSGYVRKLPLYEKKTVIDHQYFMKSITSQRLIKIITIYDIPCKIKAQYSILPCQAIILSFSTVRNFLIMMIS